MSSIWYAIRWMIGVLAVTIAVACLTADVLVETLDI